MKSLNMSPLSEEVHSSIDFVLLKNKSKSSLVVLVPYQHLEKLKTLFVFQNLFPFYFFAQKTSNLNNSKCTWFLKIQHHKFKIVKT